MPSSRDFKVAPLPLLDQPSSKYRFLFYGSRTDSATAKDGCALPEAVRRVLTISYSSPVLPPGDMPYLAVDLKTLRQSRALPR